MTNTLQIQTSLLEWYDASARQLPWRSIKNPYWTWVSEIMLQQTQVKTVIPYFETWIQKFPTLQTLAEASEEHVMKYWAGLGYYRRARMLHQGAKHVHAKWKGQIPSDIQTLQTIPGIGRYTAGAIASIAFEQRASILDGNVMRVLSRLFLIKQPIDDPKTIAKLWRFAEQILPDQRIGDFNQALMELGALVCTPEKPACHECRLTSVCQAFQKQKTHQVPVKKIKTNYQKITEYAAVIQYKDQLLIRKQKPGEKWAGLYAFPISSNTDFLSHIPQVSVPKQTALKIRYAFTRYQITAHVFLISLSTKKLPLEKTLHAAWVPKSKVKHLAFPSPHQKILKALAHV